jgi:hypothetical protein
VSYLNSPRKGCPRGMQICVWTHLGLTKLKTTSKEIQNGRRPQKKKWKTTSKQIGRQPQKKRGEKTKKKRVRRPPPPKMGNNPKKRKKEKKEDDLKKNLFSIPLKFRGKPFLGLAQLSKIFNIYSPVLVSLLKNL